MLKRGGCAEERGGVLKRRKGCAEERERVC